MTSRPPPLALLAFLAMVVLGGFNFIAVRFSNAELAPFWGAGLRFAIASVLFLAIMAGMRLPSPPPGPAQRGIVVYGLLAFFLSYALVYYALTVLPAGLASVAMALVPLVTVVLAALHRVEPFRLRGLIGALVSAGGIALVFRAQMQGGGSLPHFVALFAFVVVASETTILIKRYPRMHPVVANSGGMAIGAILLLAGSLAAGETIAFPKQPRTLLTILYLVTLGSVGLFFLFRYVIDRWTPSATNYQFVLMPLVAIPMGAWLANEAVTMDFLLGAAIVIIGVYVGALSGRRPQPTRPEPVSTALPAGPR